MSIPELSPSSILANPSYINPTVLTEHQASIVTINQQADQNIKKTASDSVTISSYALKRASTSK